MSIILYLCSKWSRPEFDETHSELCDKNKNTVQFYILLPVFATVVPGYAKLTSYSKSKSSYKHLQVMKNETYS